MAKVKNPLGGTDARGRLGKRMVFKRGGVVTRYHVPRDPKTPAQLSAREAFRNLVMSYLTQAQADLLYAAIVHLHDETYSPLSHVHDHGSLSGLGDDDHTQYYNQTRGDARYLQIANAGWQLIADSGILGADAANIDFQNIPGTFKHLRLETSLRSDANQNFEAVMMRLNNDSGANYDYFLVELKHSAGYTTVEGLAVTAMWAAHCAGNTCVAGDFSKSVIDVVDYANANINKDVLTYGGNRGAATTTNLRLYNFYAHWRSTAAINRITLYPRDGTKWKQYSRVSLFGIK